MGDVVPLRRKRKPAKITASATVETFPDDDRVSLRMATNGSETALRLSPSAARQLAELLNQAATELEARRGGKG
jgi:hypothetical protein